MARQKTSRAEFYTARLNPIHPEEAKAIEFIERHERNGYNFKQIIVDAINRAEGVTPEMFAKDSNTQLASIGNLLEEKLREFAHQLLSNGAISLSSPEEVKQEHVTKFTRNFVKGLQQRQQSSGNVDEE